MELHTCKATSSFAVSSATGNPILEHSASALDSVKGLGCHKAIYQKVYVPKGKVSKSLM